MPTYVYRCANQHQFERFYRVQDHDSAVSCEECDLVAQQVIQAPAMVKCAQDLCYNSPIDGRPITTHAARQEDLKRNRCLPYEPGMKQDAIRKTREADAALDAAIEETVCQEVAKMPSSKKAQLASELTRQGMEIEVAR